MDGRSPPAEFHQVDHASVMDAPLDSVAVARLIEEVRGTDFEVTRAYNRTYNRHNR